MTQPQPSIPIGRLLRADLSRFGLFERWTKAWTLIPAARRGVRREAKALLFAELAEATRHGVPLEVALDLMGGTGPSRAPLHAPHGPDTPLAGAARASTLVGMLLMVIWIPTTWLALLNLRPRPDLVAACFARRLREAVSAGHSLAEAMKRCEADYEPGEIASVEFAEQQGQLPRVLKRLSQFQATQRAIMDGFCTFMYQLVELQLIAVVIAFLIELVTPRYRDIWLSLGMELPWLSDLFFGYGHRASVGLALVPPVLIAVLALVSRFRAQRKQGARALLLALLVVTGLVAAWVVPTSGAYLLPALAAILLLYLVFRLLLVGTITTKCFLAIFTFHLYLIPLVIVGYILAMGRGDFPDLWYNVHYLVSGHRASAVAGLMGKILVILLVLALLFPFMGIRRLPRDVGTVEAVFIDFEKALEALAAGIGRLVPSGRALQEARWLGALGVALDSGALVHDAVNAAGEVCGGRLAERSRAAGADIEKGISLENAVQRHQLLTRLASARLGAFRRDASLPDTLVQVADESLFEAAESLRRLGRTAASLMPVLMGAFIAIALLAIYQPLWMLPNAVR